MKRSTSKHDAEPDDSTLESAYRRFGAHVYSLCMRLLGDALGAEAATVRAFVAVGRRMAQDWDDSRIFLHLREAAIADLLSTIRVPASLPESATRTVIETVPAGGQRDLRLPLKPALLELLVAQLPEAERLAYVLHDVEGLSDEAMASYLRMSRAAERRLLHRARLALRRLWLAQ